MFYSSVLEIIRPHLLLRLREPCSRLHCLKELLYYIIKRLRCLADAERAHYAAKLFTSIPRFIVIIIIAFLP